MVSLRIRIFIALLPILSAVEGQSASRLAGCPDPVSLASGLVKLNSASWPDVDESTLRAIWPNEIGGSVCHEGTCTEFAHHGRIINDHPECAESFDFNGKLKDATVVPGLNSLTINYSTRTRTEAVAVTQTLAKAVGLSARDLATIGRDADQQFSWTESRRERHLVRVDVHLAKQGALWWLIFHFARDVLPADWPGK